MNYSHQLEVGSRVTPTIQPFFSGRQKPLEASWPSDWKAQCPGSGVVSRKRKAPIFSPPRIGQIPKHYFMLTGPLQPKSLRSGSHGDHRGTERGILC